MYTFISKRKEEKKIKEEEKRIHTQTHIYIYTVIFPLLNNYGCQLHSSNKKKKKKKKERKREKNRTVPTNINVVIREREGKRDVLMFLPFRV